MLRLDKVIKPWKESAALNDHINLYGFWTETAFLTKSGDVGMILSVPGVDYESLDRSQQEYAVKRLEAALKAFGPGFHVYQYLFKSNRPDIPFAKYDDPIVEAAIEQRRKFFEAKRDHLYQIKIFYCILLEGSRSKTGVGTALARLLRDPEGAIAELKSQFTNDSMKKFLRKHIERDLQRLDQHVQAFARQLADFMQIEILNRQGQFSFFRRLLNYDDWRVAGTPQSTQFLDYQVVNSDIEAERDHLRVGDLAVVGAVTLGIVLVVRVKRRRDQRQMEQHSITAEELHALLASDQGVLLFDVRQPLDLLAYPEMIPKAQRIAPDEVLERPTLIPKEKDAVVYCTCPSDKTSRTVLRRAFMLGFCRIKFLKGGLAAWKAQGYPVEPYKEVFHLNPRLVSHSQ